MKKFNLPFILVGAACIYSITEEKQQNYYTFSESTSSLPPVVSSTPAKKRLNQARQQSAFVTLSIHSKRRFNQATIPVNDKPQKKQYCAIM